MHRNKFRIGRIDGPPPDVSTYLDDGPVAPEEVRGAGVAVGYHVELLQEELRVIRPCVDTPKKYP